MVANSGILSSLSATPTSQLIDKIDSPHSGLFKGLHSMAQGNYALKDGATLGFAHTFTTSGANIQVALTAGKGFSNGQYIAVDALSATTINKPSSGALYHWVAFADDGDGTGTISVIMGSSDGVVPDLTVTLTPISLIKVQSTDTHSTVAFQTFTTSKTENKLSIGYENSNTYTEAGSISGTSSGLFITGIGTASVATDDKVLIQDTGSSDVIKSVTVSSIVALAGGVALANDGNNRITTATGAGGINGEANLTFDGTALDITGNLVVDPANNVGTAAVRIDNADTDQMALDINADNIDADVINIHSDALTTAKVLNVTADGLTTGRILNLISDSSDTSTRRLVNIHNDNTAATGAIPLYIKNDSTADELVIENTDSGTTSEPTIKLFRNSASPAANDYLGAILFTGEDDGGSASTYANLGARIDDPSAGNEAGAIFLQAIHQGNIRTFLYCEGHTDSEGVATVNYNSQDINLRVYGTTDTELLFTDASENKVGISTATPKNILQVNTTGADGFDGIQIVREDSSTAAGDILGGIGFDSTDGNVPSSITEASAFIAAYATEDHATTDKGGELKMGISFINDDDDTVSTVLSRIGHPTSTNATVYAGAFSRAAVATVAAATYSPTIADSGTVIIMTNASSIVTLPDVGATEIGVQFTIINNSGGTLTGKIVSADTTNTRFNGAGSYAAQDIEDDKAKTFICWAADNWQVIG